jgi:phage protein
MQYKDIKLITQNSETGTVNEIANICAKIKTSKTIDSSAGKCTFTLIQGSNFKLPMGSTVSLVVEENNKKVGKFFGYIFNYSYDGKKYEYTAYDQLRYLKNSDTYVLTGKTVGQVIKTIGDDFKLRLGEVDVSNYLLPDRIEDNKSLGDIIQRALDFTLQATGHKYIIRDEFGYLCCRDLEKLGTNLVISNSSVMTSYSYKESIDSETYNYVKLYKDNQQTGKRETYIVMDSNNIKKWGKLQKTESVDENDSDIRIKNKVQQMLKLYNRPTKTLTLEGDGIIDLEPGNGVYVILEAADLAVMSLITKIEDTYESGNHSMSLEVNVL